MSDVFIGRQPILDKHMAVFAYELQFKLGDSPSEEALKETSDLIEKTQAEVGFQQVVGCYAAMMQLPKALIQKEGLPKFDPEQHVVLEIPNDVVKDIDVLRHLKELKADGFAIALDNYIDDNSSIKLASISDFVKVDVSAYTEIQLSSMLDKLQAKNVKVIADKVETEEMFLYLRKLGFDFFQGYFFTNPVIINGEKLSGNKMTLLQVMSKVNNPDTDFNELSNIIGQDVALSHKLLVAVNNPVTMIPIVVETVADALTYMGLKRLKFWVNMLMFSGMDDAPKELLTTSLMRASFCEQLAEKAGQKHDKDSFFLVGLFSNLGAFFRSPIENILQEMPLSDELNKALIHHEGLMGEALKVLKMLESSETDSNELSYEGLDASDLSGILMSASAWAQQVMNE